MSALERHSEFIVSSKTNGIQYKFKGYAGTEVYRYTLYQFVFNVFVYTFVAFSRRILVTCNCHFIIVFTYCLGKYTFAIQLEVTKSLCVRCWCVLFSLFRDGSANLTAFKVRSFTDMNSQTSARRDYSGANMR